MNSQPKIVVEGEWNSYREYRDLWEWELKKQMKERRERREVE